MVAKMNVVLWLVYAEVLVKSSSSADEQRASNVGTRDVEVSRMKLEQRQKKCDG